LLLEEMSRFLKHLLGASTVHDIKTDIAQQIYKAIQAECEKSLNAEEEKTGFGFWKKKPVDNCKCYTRGSSIH